MNKNSILMAFLLFLVGTTGATQLTGDFSLVTNCAVPDSTTYILHNNTGATQTYEIRAIGENKDWINANGTWIGEEPLRITLGDTESEEIYAFVKPQTCYVTPGEYTVTLEISNGRTFTKEIDVTVEESRVLDVDISPNRKEITQCETATYEIRVKNIGESDEKVIVGIEGMPSSWVNLQMQEFFLEKGETRDIELEIEPDCDAETTEYEFTVNASLKGTNFFTEERATLEIEDNQEIAIIPKNLSACREKKTVSTVKIRNNGLLEDTVELEISGLNWAELGLDTLILGPGQEKEIDIELESTQSAKGEYEFSLKARSTRFGKETQKDFRIELKDCYNISITGVEINGQSATGTPRACIENKPKYTFTLTNDAIEDIEAEIRVTGLDSVISPARIKLGAGETEKVEVELDLENENPGNKTFYLEVKSDRFSLKKGYEIKAEDCYNLQVDWDGLTRLIELDANCKSETYAIQVKNNGTRSQTVKATVAGPSWIYYEPVTTDIGAGETQEIYLYFAPPYDTKEGKHTATITAKGKETTKSARMEMMVYGGLYADLGTAQVEAQAEVDEVIETMERTVSISLQLSNDSNALIRVNGISSEDFNTAFEFEETMLQPQETIEVPMTLNLGNRDENRFTVTLKIDTDKGLMERDILIDLEKKPEEQETMNVGLFGIVGLGDLMLAAVVVAIIAIFAAIALKTEQANKPESGLKHLVKEVQEIPGKKLEEIGRQKKQNKNLEDIVKEVKKKHKTKPAAKKKTRARKKKK